MRLDILAIIAVMRESIRFLERVVSRLEKDPELCDKVSSERLKEELASEHLEGGS